MCSSTSTSTYPEVLADPGLLERVVANIVDNALRHAAGASVALRASSHADQVELRVEHWGRCRCPALMGGSCLP